MFEQVARELRAKLLSGALDKVAYSNESVAGVRDAARKGRAWLRCSWAVAGHGPDEFRT